MSVQVSSGNRLSRASVAIAGASGEKTILMSFARTSDSGAVTVPFECTDASAGNDRPWEISAGDRLTGRFAGYGTTADYGPNPVAATAATWYYVLARFPGADNFALYHMVEGAGSWTAGPTGTGSGFADKAIVNIFLGTNASAGDTYTGLIGMLKMWNIDIAAATVLSNLEHQYRHVQQNAANCRGCFKFASGALTTDTQAVGNLTATGTPTFDADEPSDILGDDPASSSAGALAGQIGGAGIPRLAGRRGGLAGFVKVGNIYKPKRWLWLPPGFAPQGV